jgi:hypothetical protein
MNVTTPDPIYANSYSWMIRNVILDRLKLVPPFAAGVVKFSRTPAIGPIQEQHIPYLGVYLMPDETFAEFGQNNHGPQHFLHKLTLGFSYIIENNDTDQVEELLDAGHWSIMKLLHDPDWAKWPAVDPEVYATRQMLEAVVSGSRRFVYGTAGRQNTLPIAEMQMEWIVTYRTFFEPVISDVFEAMHVKVIYPWPEDPNRQPIITEYVLEQN